MRSGFGYDIHRFEEATDNLNTTAETKNTYVTLCGVKIPYSRALKAHSDGDVALHALMDAMLGAVGLPDIGNLFPNTSDEWKDVSSIELLKIVCQRMRGCGYKISNLDITVVAESPRISPYRSEMIDVISSTLGIELDQVAVKATTNEGIGSIGRGEGICAMATVLLDNIS